MSLIDRRSVHPSATGLHDVHDPADHPPVVRPPDASGFTWQQRLKPLTLPLVQPELARHAYAPIRRQSESQAQALGYPLYGSEP
jgi:hypothetical protein